jgi:hypothetical protein
VGREIRDEEGLRNITKWSPCSKGMSHIVRSTNDMCKRAKMK